jgi:DNA modification methylase
LPTIHHGDCIEVMNQMPAESVDAIVTDPPYNLSNGSKSDAQCFREIVAEVLLPDDNNRNSQGVEGRDLAVPSLSGAGLGGERRPVRVDAGVGVPEGPVDFQGAPVAEHEVHAGDEATSSAPHGDLPGVGDAELVKHHGDFILQLADGGNAPFCDGTCSCFTEPSTGVIGVAVVVPRAPGGVSPRDGLVIDRGNANVGLVNDAGGQPEGAPLVHASGGAEDRAMLRLDLRGATGELDFTHGALEGLPLFELVSAESVTASTGAGRLSPVAKPHRVRLVGDGADGALTVHMVGHGSKSTTGFMGKVWDGWESPAAFQRWNREWVAACYRVLKPGGHIAAFGGTRTWHRLAVAIEDAGFEMRDSLAWLYGSGFPKSHDVGKSTGADKFDGWGTALKPAFEPIVLARKPLAEKTVARNVLAHGTGAINVDACRIGTPDGLPPYSYPNGPGGNTFTVGGAPDGTRSAPVSGSPSGRWPANVLLDHHAAAWVDEQSGEASYNSPGVHGISGTHEGIVYGGDKSFRREGRHVFGYGDRGGASRFFYTAKAPKRERPNVDGVQHPTVKPLAIMEWLVRLVTPPGGVVLDPFAGSGTTIEAAMREGVNVVGIEMEAEYLPLIQHRIDRQAATLNARKGNASD